MSCPFFILHVCWKLARALLLTSLVYVPIVVVLFIQGKGSKTPSECPKLQIVG